jgi:hypothetical protein
VPNYPTLPTIAKQKGTIPLIGAQESGSSSFSPDQIAGLQAWYKDAGIVTSGSDVVEWSDSSINGKHLAAVIANSPTTSTLNGHTVLSFTSTDGGEGGSALGHGEALFSEGNSATVFIVARKSSNWAEAGLYTTRSAGQANHHPFSDFVVYDSCFSDTRKNCGTQIVTINNNWRIFAFRSEFNLYDCYIDGGLQFTTGTNEQAFGSDFILGAGAFNGSVLSYSLEGLMAEVIVYNVLLSAGEMDQVGGYLATRFALTWTP